MPWHRVGAGVSKFRPTPLNPSPHNTGKIGMENQIILGEAVVRRETSPRDLTSVDRAIPKVAV